MRVSPEQARFITMASDESSTWELNDQDGAALQWAVDQIESPEAELETIRKAVPQAAIAPAPEIAASINEDGPKPGGIPFMITNKMRKQLGKLGYSPEDVQAMTPADAHAVLQAPDDKRAKVVESDVTPRVGGRRAGGTITRSRKGT